MNDLSPILIQYIKSLKTNDVKHRGLATKLYESLKNSFPDHDENIEYLERLDG